MEVALNANEFFGAQLVIAGDDTDTGVSSARIFNPSGFYTSLASCPTVETQYQVPCGGHSPQTRFRVAWTCDDGACGANTNLRPWVDSDLDGVANGCDGCPNNANPTQADSDSDGVQDACDTCPSGNQFTDATLLQDNDGDTIPNCIDPCPNVDSCVAVNPCPSGFTGFHCAATNDASFSWCTPAGHVTLTCPAGTVCKAGSSACNPCTISTNNQPPIPCTGASAARACASERAHACACSVSRALRADSPSFICSGARPSEYYQCDASFQGWRYVLARRTRARASHGAHPCARAGRARPACGARRRRTRTRALLRAAGERGRRSANRAAPRRTVGGGRASRGVERRAGVARRGAARRCVCYAWRRASATLGGDWCLGRRASGRT
jgi:hypothetical protein